ncbi:natterin-1-like [Vanacampus margaritifer]
MVRTCTDCLELMHLRNKNTTNKMRKPSAWTLVITFGLSLTLAFLVLYLWYNQDPAAAQHPPGESAKCGWWLDNPSNDFCYLLDRKATKTWEEAQDHCVLLGGNLLSINDSNEQTFVHGLAALEPTFATSLWLGANASIGDDGAKWCDGSPITYVHLDAGNPDDDYPGRCLSFITPSGYWRVDACHNKRSFICKKRGTVTSPILEPEHLPIPSFQRQEMPKVDVPSDEANLEWKWWTGSVPDHAVSIYNSYMSRKEYICKVDCHAGYYVPKTDWDVCVYTSDRAAYTKTKFELLVNIANVEVLEWKNNKDGSVSPYSIKTCNNKDYYVGMNRYGLGEVDVSQKVFNLPWGRSVWTYPEYQVLVTNKDVEEEHLMDVTYETAGVTPLKYIPQEVDRHSIPNWSCDLFNKAATFHGSFTSTRKWEINFGVLVKVGVTITAGIPFLRKEKIDFKPVSTFKLSPGTPITETTSQAVTAHIQVPPRLSCDIRLLSRSTTLKIPFTARLKRTYGNRETKWVRVTGTFHSEELSEFKAEIEVCHPLPDTKPC